MLVAFCFKLVRDLFNLKHHPGSYHLSNDSVRYAYISEALALRRKKKLIVAPPVDRQSESVPEVVAYRLCCRTDR